MEYKTVIAIVLKRCYDMMLESTMKPQVSGHYIYMRNHKITNMLVALFMGT
jgi:hypothetical protein